MGRGGGESAECGAGESAQLCGGRGAHKHNSQISSITMKDFLFTAYILKEL